MRRIMIMIFAVSFFAACEYETIQPIVVELPDNGDPISFSEKIQPVFTSKCITCHASTSPILTDGNAYGNLVSGGYLNTTTPEESSLYMKMQDGHPSASSTMSATEKAYLLKWIEEGASNN